MTIKFIVTALSATFALAACSSDGPQQNPVSASLYKSLKGSLQKNRQPPLTTQILRTRLTPEVRTQIGRPTMIAELPRQKVAAVVIEAGQNGSYINWQALDGVGITTLKGLLISTRGLGFDLMASDVEGISSFIKHEHETIGHGLRVHSYLDGENQEVVIKFGCSYERIAYETVKSVIESCTSESVSIQNRFWLNSRQEITNSIQWAGTRNGYMLLEGPISP